MTPDPLPVALPELTVVARQAPDHKVWCARLDPDGGPCDCGAVRADLVRKSDAEAALRAQAEEVAALRVLLVACERVAIRRGDKELCDTIGQIGEHYQSSRLAVVLRASKQEKP